MKADEKIYYKKVFIKDEKDLPKEDGYYFVKRKDTIGAGDGMIGYMSDIDNGYWFKNILWYLCPISLRDELIKFLDTINMNDTSEELVDEFLNSKQ